MIASGHALSWSLRPSGRSRAWRGAPTRVRTEADVPHVTDGSSPVGVNIGGWSASTRQVEQPGSPPKPAASVTATSDA